MSESQTASEPELWLDQDYQDLSGVIETMRVAEKYTTDYGTKSIIRTARLALEHKLQQIEARLKALKKE